MPEGLRLRCGSIQMVESVRKYVHIISQFCVSSGIITVRIL